MTTKNIDTYEGWAKHDRFVRPGEKAQQFAHHPDGRSCAVFHLDQTEQAAPIDLNECTLVSREEHLAWKGPGPKKKRLRVRFHRLEDEKIRVFIWVGASKAGLELVKKSNYMFDGQQRRWVKTYRSIDEVTTVLDLLKAHGWEVHLDNELP
jgi:hypothetical protein